MFCRQLFLVQLTILAMTAFASTSFAQAKQADEKKAQALFEMFTNTTGRSIEREKVVHVSKGKVLSAAMDDRGRYLVTFDDQGNLSLWDLSEGRQVSTRKPAGEPHSGVVAIDSRQLIGFGSPSGKVEIFNGEKQEAALNTYDELTSSIVDIGFTDQGRFFAVDESSAAIIGKARKQEVELIHPAFGDDDKPRTFMGVAGEKSWWRIAIVDKMVRHEIFDGRNLIENGPPFPTIQKMRSRDGSAAGSAIFDFATRNLCFCNEIDEGSGRWKQGPNYTAMGEIIAMERNLLTLEIWLVTNYSIEICDLRVHGLDRRVILLPDEMKRPMLQLAPSAGRLVSIDGGDAIAWKIVGQPIPRAYHLQSEINRLLDKKDIATLDLLADKLDGEIDLYSGTLFETPYVHLFRRFLYYPNAEMRMAQRIKLFEDMLKDHPDSKMLRMACYYLYSVPPTLNEPHASAENMRIGWEHVKPLLSLEKPPAEAYVALFAAGPILDLPLGGYLSRAYADWPKYPRIYAEAALALSPIYGGKPEAAAQFAAKAADALGDEEGDVMYVQIARYVAHYNGDIDQAINKLKFDSKRMKRGYLILADRYDHTVTLNEALRFAGITQDKAMAEHLVSRFADLATFPYPSVAPNVYPTVDQALQPLAKRFNEE